MTELLEESGARTEAEWRSYYDEHMPNGIAAATSRIKQKLTEMRRAMNSITDEMVEAWVCDLVYTKTFTGLRVQEVILAYLAEKVGASYRIATVEEEAKGIDGWINDHPVQVKSITYKTAMMRSSEVINAPIVYYEKKREGVSIEYPDEILGL